MTVRWKPALIISILLLALMLSMLIISRAILLSSFSRLEEEDVRDNVRRALNALDDRLVSLSRVAGDYAAWDDSYDFVRSRDRKFITVNLVDTTFTGLKLNLMAFCDTRGRIVYAKGFDLNTQRQTSLPRPFIGAIPSGSGLLRQTDKGGGPDGIIVLPNGPMLTAAKPILPSDKKGAPRGTLIMGRYLDNDEIGQLSRTTNLSIDVRQLSDSRLTPDYMKMLGAKAGIIVKPLSEDIVAGYSPIRDIHGNPALILKVDMQRSLYRQGLASIRYFLLWLLLLAVSFGAAIYHYLDKFLAAQQSRHEGEKRYRTVVEQAAEGIVLFDASGNEILEANQAFRSTFGIDADLMSQSSLPALTGINTDDLGRLLERVRLEKQPFFEELRLRRHDGASVDVSMSLSGMTLDGKELVCAVIHDITERKRTEDRLAKLNECFLGFTSDPDENINRLTSFCGELMGAACALYNRLDDGMLRTMAHWHAPDDFKTVDRPEGHICHEVIKLGGNRVFVARDLPGSRFAVSDSNVLRYNLQTYVGVPVKCSGYCVGSLCVVYQHDFLPSEEDRKLMGIVAVAVEAAEESKQAAQILKESESFARSTLDALPERIAILDEKGCIIAVNQQWKNFARDNLCVLQNVFEGGNYLEACDAAQSWEAEFSSAFATGIRSVLRGQRESFSLEYANSPGEEAGWFLGRASCFPGNGPTKVVLVHEEITDLKRAEGNIQKLAYYDTLTGLPNRLLLHDRLQQAVKRADRNRQMLAVMFLDLDHFKVINDTLGHSAGDQLLKKVAERLSRHIRSSDTVARMGGDEFVIVINQISSTRDVSHIAALLIEKLSPPFELDGQEVFITTSMGIVLYPVDGNDGDKLLKNADTAMYLAKERGRNTFQFFSAEMNARAEERLTLETSLRHAIEREEFSLRYQPWMDLRTGRITGVEALLRWDHPLRGIISPDSFIQLAEETGLIIPIGEWVLKSACAEMSSLREKGIQCPCVAVNMSSRQFKKYNLLDAVADALEETGTDPTYLELELTESIMMENAEENIALLHAIKRMGVSLSVDDFGTGYSSLNYLKRFPIDKLKIDRSFIQGIPSDTDDTGITQAIIAMARILRLSVVAEGVETMEQLSFLREHGCDAVQGYHVSKPLALSELADFLNRPGRISGKL
ncbi:MAG: EAL domain-containing protein [Geobacteraceae bacterium]|nr:EAL domain-containing protein [Geobacteraceae bacterium]